MDLAEQESHYRPAPWAGTIAQVRERISRPRRLKQVMSPRVPTFAASMVATAVLCGCAHSPIDDAYRRGYISSADQRRLTRESVEEQTAAQNAAMQRFQQQPEYNPHAKKAVGEQPTEDPWHTGRPLDETMEGQRR